MSEELECRVCRLEGEDDHPLYHPCLCSGSIGLVHQDCLLQWLEHSNTNSCELCKIKYNFQPKYAEGVPNWLPIYELFPTFLGLIRTKILPKLLKYSFVISVWFGGVHVVAILSYIYCMKRSLMWHEAFSWSSVKALVLYGIALDSAIALSLLIILSFADYLRLHAVLPPAKTATNALPNYKKANNRLVSVGETRLTKFKDEKENILSPSRFSFHIPSKLTSNGLDSVIEGDEDETDSTLSSNRSSSYYRRFSESSKKRNESNDFEEVIDEIMNISESLIDLDEVENRSNKEDTEEGWMNILDHRKMTQMKSSLNIIDSNELSENEEEFEEQIYQDDQDAKNQENFIGDNDLDDQLDFLEEEAEDAAIMQRDGFGGILQALALIFGFNGPILDVFKAGLIFSLFCSLYLFIISLMPYFFGYSFEKMIYQFGYNFSSYMNKNYLLDSFLSISSDNISYMDLFYVLFMPSSASSSVSSILASSEVGLTFIRKISIAFILLKNKIFSLEIIKILLNVQKLSLEFNIPLNFFDFFHILFGYFLVIVSILLLHLFFHFLIVKVLKNKQIIQDIESSIQNPEVIHPSSKDLLFNIYKFLIVILKIIKLTLLLIFRIFFIPLFVGFFILLIFSSTILPYNALDWINFLTFNSIGIYALTWVCGISFMLFISLSTLQWREILHPTMIGKYIRPQEPHTELIRSLSEDSMIYHVKKFISSFLVYILLLFVSLYLPISIYLSIMKKDLSSSNYNNLVVSILSSLVTNAGEISPGATVTISISSILNSCLNNLINLGSFSSSAFSLGTNSTILLKEQYNHTLYHLLPSDLVSNNTSILTSFTPYSLISSLSNSINMLTSSTNSSFFSYLYFWYLAPEVQAPLELLTFYVIYLTLLESRKDFIGYTQHMWLVFVTKKLDLIHYFLPCPIRAIIPFSMYLHDNSILNSIKLKSDERIFQISQDHLDEFNYYYNKVNTNNLESIKPPYNLGDFIIIGSPLRRPLKGWDSRKIIRGIRWSFVNEYPTETEYNLSPKIKSINYFNLKLILFYLIILLQFIVFTITIIILPLNFGRFLMNIFYVPLPFRHDPFCFFLGLFLLSTFFIYFIDLIYYNYYKKFDRKNYLSIKVHNMVDEEDDDDNVDEIGEENENANEENINELPPGFDENEVYNNENDVLYNLDRNRKEIDDKERRRRRREANEENIIELPPGFDDYEDDDNEDDDVVQVDFLNHLDQQNQGQIPQNENQEVPQPEEVPNAPNNLTQSHKQLVSSIYNYRLFNLIKNYFQILHNPSSFRLFFELFLTCTFFGLLVYFASSLTLFDLSVVLTAFSGSPSLPPIDTSSVTPSNSFYSSLFTPTSPLSYLKLNADVLLNSPSFFAVQNYSVFVYIFKYLSSFFFNSISLNDYYYFKSLGVEDFNFSSIYTSSSSFLSTYFSPKWSLNNLNLLCLGEISIFPLPFYLFIPSFLWIFLSGCLILSTYYYIVFRYNNILFKYFKDYIPKKMKKFNKKNIKFIKNINKVLNQQVKQTILKQQAITFRQYLLPLNLMSGSTPSNHLNIDNQNLQQLLTIVNNNNNNQPAQDGAQEPRITPQNFNQQLEQLLKHEALVKDPSQFNSNISLNFALKNFHYFLTFIIRKNLKIFFSLFFFVIVLTFVIASLISRNFYFFEYSTIKNVNILLFNSKILYYANNNSLLASGVSISAPHTTSYSILTHILSLASTSSPSLLVSSIITAYESQNIYPISFLNYLKPMNFISLNNFNLFFVSNYRIFLVSLRLSCLITLFKLVFYFFFFIMKKIIWNFNRIIRDSKYLIGYQLLNFKKKNKLSK